MVERIEFGLGGGSNNKFHNFGADLESPIQSNGVTVLWHPSHEKSPTCPALGVCFGSKQSVGMYIHDHIQSKNCTFASTWLDR